MNAPRSLALAAALLLAACDHPAAVVVDGASATRMPDGHVQVDVLVTGADETGHDVGHYCVSAHWLGPIDGATADPAPTYAGELDAAIQCFEGLGDGDRRTVRLASKLTGGVLTPGTTLRCQASVASAINTMDIDNP